MSTAMRKCSASFEFGRHMHASIQKPVQEFCPMKFYDCEQVKPLIKGKIKYMAKYTRLTEQNKSDFCLSGDFCLAMVCLWLRSTYGHMRLQR